MKKKPQKRPLREHIAARDIIHALEQHILGKKKMNPSQVQAALALLRKRMPDLVRHSLTPQRRKKTAEAQSGHEEALKELK